MKNLLILPDGTELFSGANEGNSIASCTFTEKVNTDSELMPGAVCASCLEVKIITDGSFYIDHGTVIDYYQVSDNGSRTKIGTFICEKPKKPSRRTLTITAYDYITKLDKDLTVWLASLSGWPYTVQSLANMVCVECGLTLSQNELPNGTYLVNAFGGTGITGRQIMAWIGQLSGRFCRADVNGNIEFAWYVQNQTLIEPTGENYYFQGGFSYVDYQIAKVQKVQLQLSEDDVGTIYPDDLEGANTLSITGNYLLTTNSAAALEPIAEALYEMFKNITYTPGSVSVPAETPVGVGDIITVRDPNNKTITMYVMSRVQSGQKATLSCTGSARRDSTAAVNEAQYKAFTGRVLNLQMDVEGLKLENKNAAGDRAALALDIEGIRTEVAKQSTETADIQEKLSTMEQDAESVRIQIQSIQTNGVDKITTGMGYTFDDTGLHITRPGDEISTVIDQTGMQVSRSGTNVLQATAAGVKAIDITVNNYLMIGKHARFENYTDGVDSKQTACFWRDG